MGNDLKKILINNSNAITIDRKYLRIISKFKNGMIAELINPSKDQMMAEEAFNIAKEAEYQYMEKGLEREEALREAVRKFNNKKGDRR